MPVSRPPVGLPALSIPCLNREPRSPYIYHRSSPTWKSWLSQFEASVLLELPGSVAEQEWNPSDQDRDAAWDLYTELRTRVTVQPLHYTHGDEATAVQSVIDLSKISHEIIRKAGPQARHVATLSVFALNQVVRPFAAKWHERKCSGELANEDIRHRLRSELIQLQAKLRVFTTVLGAIAEGAEFRDGSQRWRENGNDT